MDTVCSLKKRLFSPLIGIGFFIFMLTLSACSVLPTIKSPQDNYSTPKAKPQRGMASFYGNEDQGNLTASGEPLNNRDYTAAHRSLPFGQKVLVHNPANGRSVLVRINDRSASTERDIITISGAAAAEIGILQVGKALVEIAPFYGDALSVEMPPQRTISNGQPPLISPGIRDIYPPATLPPSPTYTSRATSNPPSYATNGTVVLNDGWTVQVGAPNNRAFAEDHRRKLGAESWIVEKTSPQGMRYNIYYGRYQERTDADQAKLMLVAKGYNGAFVKSLMNE